MSFKTTLEILTVKLTEDRKAINIQVPSHPESIPEFTNKTGFFLFKSALEEQFYPLIKPGNKITLETSVPWEQADCVLAVYAQEKDQEPFYKNEPLYSEHLERERNNPPTTEEQSPKYLSNNPDTYQEQLL